MKRMSQNERILEVLAGGQWIDHHRLYEIGCVAHSRIAELRARGHKIEQRRVTVNGRPVWQYRLVGEVEEGATEGGAVLDEHGEGSDTSIAEAESSGTGSTARRIVVGAPSSTSSFPYLGSHHHDETLEQLTLDAA